MKKTELTSSGIASVCDTKMLRHMTAMIAMRQNLINLDIVHAIWRSRKKIVWLQKCLVNPWFNRYHSTTCLKALAVLYAVPLALYVWLRRRNRKKFSFKSKIDSELLFFEKKVVRCFMNERSKYYAVSMRLRCVL